MSESAEHPVAFFDVDETLVSVRTLEAFLLHYLHREPTMVPPERLRELTRQVVHLDRSEFNRLYFGLWAGQPVAQVMREGRRWYAAASQTPGFFRPNVLQRLRTHQMRGERVVLVSGSFAAPLIPLADDVGADALYCTQLVGRDGAYTGQISAAMIGEDKRRVVDHYLAGAPGVTSWGYGDHPSDLELLEAVTTPVVVGSDPAMLAVAADRGWEVLPIDRPLAPRT